MTIRHHYVLDLADVGAFRLLRREDVTVRSPTRDDHGALAELMLDAYRGTIDYEGEGIEEAVAEVAGHFDGAPIDEASTLALIDDEPVAACLVARYDGDALVGYVMTVPAFKRQGLGRAVTAASLVELQKLGYGTVHAWITEGNKPSESIFVGLGFEVVD